MSQLKLGDLFPETHRKEMVFAISSDGNLVHVLDVATGLKCNCTCPQCGSQLIARNHSTELVMAHFMHQPGTNNKQCSHAGETALHRAAKDFLAAALELTLPERRITDAGLSAAFPQKTWKFDSATLEKSSGQIVPDVMVSLGERKLIVEFYVTHPCGEEKIARIRALGFGAIEVDLSRFRDQPLAALENMILHKAPRHWLHNPRDNDLLQEIESQKTERLRLQNAEAVKVRRRYLRAEQTGRNRSSVYEKRLQFEGLSPMIEIAGWGSGCFLVRPAEWQAAILIEVALKSNTPFDEFEAFTALVELNYVLTDFEKVADDVAMIVRADGTQFLRPTEAIADFLSKNTFFESFGQAPRRRWQLETEIRQTIDIVRASNKLIQERADQLRRQADFILRSVPREEQAGFDIDDWMGRTIPSRTYRPIDTFRFDESRWQIFFNEFRDLLSPFWPRSGDQSETLGLPLASELERRLLKRLEENARREQEEKARREVAAQERLTELMRVAGKESDPDSHSWLDAPSEQLNGLSPTRASFASEDAHKKAMQLLRVLVENQRRLAREKSQRDEQITLLRKQIIDLCHDDFFADTWMKGTNPQLGMRRPMDICVNQASRLDCFRVFSDSYKKRRH